MLKASKNKYPFLAKDYQDATLWMTSEYDEDYCISFSILSQIPEMCSEGEVPHSLVSEMEHEGVDSLVLSDKPDTSPVQWLLQNGISPHQPFQIRFTSEVMGPDLDGEYEYWSGSDLLKVEKLDLEVSIKRWSEWISGLIRLLVSPVVSPVVTNSNVDIGEYIFQPDMWGELSVMLGLSQRLFLGDFWLHRISKNIIEDEYLNFPPPGSSEAINMGCRCCPLINENGDGYEGRKDKYIICTSCSLHKSLDSKERRWDIVGTSNYNGEITIKAESRLKLDNS